MGFDNYSNKIIAHYNQLLINYLFTHILSDKTILIMICFELNIFFPSLLIHENGDIYH